MINTSGLNWLLSATVVLWIALAGCYACLTLESQALLTIKGDDLSQILASWKPRSDCCHGWVGISCNRVTRRVVQLNVTGLGIEGELSADLCNLDAVEVINLSNNNFSGHIPACLWNVPQLRFLDLSQNPFDGGLSASTSISPSSRLQTLGLSHLPLSDGVPQWISEAVHLEHLHLTGSKITEIPSSFGHLWRLKTLTLNRNSFRFVPSFISNLSRLQTLDLAENQITSVPEILGDLPRLQHLNLTGNLLTLAPASLGHISSLIALDMHSNEITDMLFSFGRLSKLKYLDLSFNKLSTLEIEFGSSVPSLECLLLSDNFIKVTLPAVWSSFPRLTKLDLARNYLEGNIPNGLGDLLQHLDLSDNRLSGPFPASLENLTNLHTVNLAGNMLAGKLPQYVASGEQFHPTSFNISRNNFTGPVPDFNWGTDKHAILDLHTNKFTGFLPALTNCTFSLLRLYNNRLTGSIPASWSKSTRLEMFDVSKNMLSGPIPEYFGSMEVMEVFELTYNKFTGTLPSSLGNSSRLQRLKLGGNQLTGPIPNSFCRTGSTLLTFAIPNNNFSGEIPSSLSNCSSLRVLDLSLNQFHGELPPSLENLGGSLRVLMVPCNKLEGEFPAWITQLRSLQVLDLSSNNYVGELPRNFSQLEAYKTAGVIDSSEKLYNDTLYNDFIRINVNGGHLDLAYILSTRTSFDVSHNLLSGTIPDGLGELRGLLYLNLFGNNFTGLIPPSLAHLSDLISLDMSHNNLSGTIPQQLGTMSFLSHFNVAYNRLTGRIPSGTQFSILNSSMFSFNAGLCGPPLPECLTLPQPPEDVQEESGYGVEDWISFTALYLGTCIGFGTMSLALVFSRSFRIRVLCLTELSRKDYVYRAAVWIIHTPDMTTSRQSGTIISRPSVVPTSSRGVPQMTCALPSHQ